MSAHESEIMAINITSRVFENEREVTERLVFNQGWCKWTTIKRVRKPSVRTSKPPLSDRDAHIRTFINKYHYYGIEVVTDLELSENSDPSLVKELNNYCECELEKLKKQAKQKRKDIRRLATINKKAHQARKSASKHLPVYNRTRDQRNHARENTRRNLRVIKEKEEQIQLLCEQEKREIEAIVDEAFSLENYGVRLLPPVETPETPFDWSNIHEYEEPTGILEEFLEVVSELEPIEGNVLLLHRMWCRYGTNNPRQLCGKTTCLN